MNVSGDDPQGWLRQQLFDRRILLVTGPLDLGTATEVGAALMTLDATGDGPVELRIDAADGTVDAALTLMDTIDLLGVPVRGACVGQVGGPAVGVLAVCHHRTLAPHARVRLTEPLLEGQGDAGALGALASAHLEAWSSWCARVAAASGQTVEDLVAATATGRYLTAGDAVAFGLADEVMIRT